jgi:transposase
MIEVEIIKSKEEFENFVITKHAEGISIRSLAKILKVGRNTIRKILRSNESRRDNGHDILTEKKSNRKPKKKKLDDYAPKMKELLEKYPKITGVRMFEELQENGYEGSISLVREKLSRMRPSAKKTAINRFETEAGVQGQMDWSPYKIKFTEEGKKDIQCFSYILGYSRRHYIDFTYDRKFHTLIRRHQDAFKYFGGVPLQCLYDGEKTIVLRFEAGKPVLNPSFVAFITHYKCKPIIVRKARTKGKIEKPFQYVEGNLLNAREFRNMSHLREVSKWWMKEKSDRHIHDTTNYPPLDLFIANEQDKLQSLPLCAYDSSEVKLLVARGDAVVEFETNFYSVPENYVGDIMSLKATENEIFVYSPELDLVANHERIPFGSNKKIENPAHRISNRVRYSLEGVKENFLSLGTAAAVFLKGLKDQTNQKCGFHARYILNMKEKYHAADINKALKHANKYNAFDCKSIERILRSKARQRTLESIRNDKAREELEKGLPKIKQRELEEYSELFSQKTNEKEN